MKKTFATGSSARPFVREASDIYSAPLHRSLKHFGRMERISAGRLHDLFATTESIGND